MNRLKINGRPQVQFGSTAAIFTKWLSIQIFQSFVLLSNEVVFVIFLGLAWPAAPREPLRPLPPVMEGEILGFGSVRQNVWTARSCDCRAAEEEGGGKGGVGVGGGDSHIVGSVEMKEVLQYISHLLERCFFSSPFFPWIHVYKNRDERRQDGLKVVQISFPTINPPPKKYKKPLEKIEGERIQYIYNKHIHCRLETACRYYYSQSIGISDSTL